MNFKKIKTTLYVDFVSVEMFVSMQISDIMTIFVVRDE